MAESALEVLFEKFPVIIAEMPEKFSSHEFILRLAQEYQPEYIEALYVYRHTERLGTPAPFLIVHGALAQHLLGLSELVRKVGEDTSKDIFGQVNECALWQKV